MRNITASQAETAAAIQSPRINHRWWILLTFAAIAYLYFLLFLLSHTPVLLGGDQAFFWMYAQRMFGGQHVYRDFFQFTPPGADLVYLALFRIFGLRVWVTNAADLALGVALCWACFAVAEEIVQPYFASVATFLFLTVIYGRLLNGTHHLFSVLMVLCAVKVGMRSRTPHALLLVGCLLGLASFFTQTRGTMALIAFAAFLLWSSWRETKDWRFLMSQYAALGCAFAGTLLLLNALFIGSVGMRELWYFQITYVRTHMVHGPGTWSLGLPFSRGKLPQLAAYLGIYMLVPVTYTVAFVRLWQKRKRGDLRLDNVLLLALVGSSLFLEVAFSLNWLRLFAVAMPAMILLLWIVEQMGRVRQYGLALLWFLIAGIAIHQAWAAQRGNHAVVTTPGGEVAVSSSKSDELRWLVQRTQPGQFLFEAGGPGFSLPLQVRSPVFIDEIHANSESEPKYVLAAVRELESTRTPFVVWPSRLYDADDPTAARAIAFFRVYLEKRYYRSQVFPSGDEVWERKPD